MANRMRSQVPVKNAAARKATAVVVTASQRKKYRHTQRRYGENPQEWARRILSQVDDGQLVPEEDVLFALRLTGDVS